MFADRAKVFIKSGKGGDGHVSFRRELYVPNGGPDGGDGGRGGDVIFQVDTGKNTLIDFRHIHKYIAKDGQEGGKRRCHGADADDLIVKVPEGTVIKDFESGKVIADMSGDNKREVILKGGKGGLGNMHFATSTMQVPKYAQPGQPGQELWVQLELKVIATPGHTAGSVCYYLPEEEVLLSGDTLFQDSYGRTDLPTGSSRALVDSVLRKLFILPGDTMVYPGHGEPTTIGYEAQNNPIACYR